MTNEEYLELKNRLMEDGLLLVLADTKTSKQHGYFREASQYVCKRFKNAKMGTHAGWGPLYENARKIVMWTYGAKRVIDMPDSVKEEANQTIINICEQAIKTIEERI